MKKNILLISALLIMAACSKNNNPAPVASVTPGTAKIADLAGKWIVTADTTFSGNGTQFTVNQVGSNATYFQFNSDGTASSGNASDGLQNIFVYTINNGTVVITEPSGNTAISEMLKIYAITKNSLGLRLVSSSGTYEDAFFTRE